MKFGAPFNESADTYTKKFRDSLPQPQFFLAVKRAEILARAVVGPLLFQRSKQAPRARAEDAFLGDVVHGDRDAQQRRERNQVGADVAVADGTVIRAPVVHDGV